MAGASGPGRRAGRPQRAAPTVLAVVVVAMIAAIALALARGDDDGSSAPPAASAPAPRSTGAADLPGSIDSGSTGSTQATTSVLLPSGSAPVATAAGTSRVVTSTAVPASTANGGQPPESASPDAPNVGDGPPADVPRGTIPGGEPGEVCRAIIERLETYRTHAIDGPVGSIGPLLPALEELEFDIFTAAELQDWGDRIIEQLVNVRREWSTALSAAESGDSTEAELRARAAVEFLDAAIAVPCPQ